MTDSPWTIGRLLTWTTDFLRDKGAESPRLDAEVLLAFARGCKRIELYTAFEDAASDELRERFRSLVKERAAGKPVAYLVGQREFFSLPFEVTTDVLIPRPETELVVVRALDLAKEATQDRYRALHIADVGTGSGVLAISLAKHLPNCQVTATDISSAALEVARRNADRHGVEERLELIETDILEGVSYTPYFDLIVSNPPYIATAELSKLADDVRKYEPTRALDGGKQGTDVIERLLPQAAEHLRPGGWLLMEISPTIVGRVEQLLETTPELERRPTLKDLAGLARRAGAAEGGVVTHPLRWMALIALDRPVLPSFDAVAAWYGEHFPDAPPLVAAGSTESLLTMTIGEYTAAAALVPRPIPWSQLEGPADTAWYWPDAAAALRDHAAHLLVTLVDEGGRPIAKSLALTRLTAALTATSPSVGVFWGPGRLVHQSAAYIEQAEQASETNLPLFLWVDFRVEELDDGALRLYTTGLDALGGEELEAARYDGPPQRLVEFAYNIAHYQLDRRKTIRDGDTIGLTEEVQVTAHRGPSMLGGEMEVLQLDFAGGETGGSPR